MNALAVHWHTIRTALAAERERARSLARTSETAFLPSALEIVERPVSPTARAVTRLSLGGLLFLLLWLSFGTVEIVAVATGRLIPGGQVKTVESLQPGIVRAIFVADNQSVRAGQSLLELDPTLAGADLDQARQALLTARLDLARDRAVLDALEGRPLVLERADGVSVELMKAQMDLARETLATIQQGAANQAAGYRAAVAAHAEALQQVAKLDQTLPLLDKEMAVYEELLTKGFVAKMKVLEIRRQRLGTVKDREIARAAAAKAQADAEAAAHGAQGGRSDARARLAADLVRARSEMELRSQDLLKALERSRLQRLVSPVDGVVTQLSVHTIGGVVEAAKALMVVVPSAGPLVAEVQISNEDVGFVHPGQEVALKLAPFPFTRFGTVAGRIESVAANAIVDQAGKLIFPARISLYRPVVVVEGVHYRLVPGMAVTADIRTGKRTLMNYLLSPLRAIVGEAARER